MNPTTYSVGNTYCPILTPGTGRGSQSSTIPHPGQSENHALQRYRFSDSGRVCRATFFPGQRRWYFIACLIEPDNKTAQYVVGDRGSGTVWASEVLSFTGELNRSCTADLILGMHADSYWYAGGWTIGFWTVTPSLPQRTWKTTSFPPSVPTAAIPPGMWTASRSRGRSRSGHQAAVTFGRCADHSGGGLQPFRHGACVCDQRVRLRHHGGFPGGDFHQR